MSTQKKKTTTRKKTETEPKQEATEPSTLIKYILSILKKLVATLEKAVGEEEDKEVKHSDARKTQDLVVSLLQQQMDEEDAMLVFDIAIVGRDGVMGKRTQGQSPLPGIFNDDAKVEAYKRLEGAYFSSIYGPFRTQWQTLMQQKFKGFHQPGLKMGPGKEEEVVHPDEHGNATMTEEET